MQTNVQNSLQKPQTYFVTFFHPTSPQKIYCGPYADPFLFQKGVCMRFSCHMFIIYTKQTYGAHRRLYPTEGFSTWTSFQITHDV